MTRYKEIDISKVRTYSATQRPSKVTTSLEGTPAEAGISMARFLKNLPGILKADVLVAVARAVVAAKA